MDLVTKINRLKKAIKNPVRTAEYIVRRVQELKYNYNFRRLFYNIEEVPITEPIFFLGAQGAGLTLVSRMIRRHPKVVYICGNSEKWMFKDEIHNAHWNIQEDIPEEFSLRSPGFNNVNSAMENHEIYGYERSWLYATKQFLQNYRLTEKAASVRLEKELKKIIRKSIIAHAKNPMNARFTDMSQSFSLKVPFLNKVLDNPKFILIIRNPYAMCKREVTKMTGRYEKYNSKPTYEENLELACEHYSNLYTIALRDGKNLKNFQVYRFEDIVDRPVEKMREICAFTDLSFEDRMIPSEDDKIPFGSRNKDKWYPIRNKVNSSYLEQLNPDDVAIIEEYCKDLIDKFDYCPE